MNELAVLLFNTYSRVLERPMTDMATFASVLEQPEVDETLAQAQASAAAWQRIADEHADEPELATLLVATQAVLDAGPQTPRRLRAITSWLGQKTTLLRSGARQDWASEAIELRQALGDALRGDRGLSG